MNNIRIGTRLGAAFIFILAMLLITVLTGLSRIQSLGNTAETLAGSRYQKAAAAVNLRYYATDMTRLVRNVIILNGDPSRQAAFKKDYDALQEKLAAASDGLDRLLTTPQGRILMKKIRTEGGLYVTFSDDVVTLAMQKKPEEATRLLFGPRFQTQLDYLKAVKDMMEHQESQMKKAGASALQERQSAVLLLSILSVAAVLLAATLAWLITRSITRPLNNALAAAQRIAQGNLSVPVPVAGRDETGRLLCAIAEMQHSLVQTVSTVRQNSESVATASLQIAQGNSDLSQRTEEQASALEQTAATMSQLSITVRNNADNARQAAQLAVNVRDVASQGNEVTTDITVTMKSISESSARIADITSVIDSIAFQTNILALNAAVEAARAGEQGRGFAVVAGEVRTLAQRSATAAGEIRHLIEANSASVSAGNALAGRSAVTMAEIVSSVGQLSDTVEEITAASAEQARGIEQVGIAVTEMDGVTQQNASLVEESASASQSLREQAALLLQSVSVFTLANGESESVAVIPAVRPIAAVSKKPQPESPEDNWTTF
ncbi:methyl-accepting chemotaxis protein [Pantoea vagans]|uniref:methyl-accepting chemotaxis protein n=1 Tax=Pantoea vagans TaxID=470934 RepID=UPI000D78798B|nr:methyl-accepting chemotaxis protein [Pantoea vagans]AWP35327.1 methyl-accepting chemotaxis protein [Pantoea vagans]